MRVIVSHRQLVDLLKVEIAVVLLSDSFSLSGVWLFFDQTDFRSDR